MNMFKKNGGFTLVELIVVIAILAILAGVAIPAYSGYITKANEAADVAVLDAVKTAAMAYNALEGEVSEVTVKTAEVTINGGDTNIATDPDFLLYFTGSETGNYSVTFKSDTYANGATWYAEAQAADEENDIAAHDAGWVAVPAAEGND